MSNKRIIIQPVKLPTAENPVESCYEAILPLNRKCVAFRRLFKQMKEGNRVARKRLIREFLPILKEMQNDVGPTIQTLEKLAPTGKPLTEAEVAALMAPGRIGS